MTHDMTYDKTENMTYKIRIYVIYIYVRLWYFDRNSILTYELCVCYIKIGTEISNFLENRIPMQLNLKLYGF